MYNFQLYFGITSGSHSLVVEEEMKVGPKGQVVIPRVFRNALKISPGSKVVLRLENDTVILKKGKRIDAAAAEFERIAKIGKSISRISPHSVEEELESRRRKGRA